MKGDLLYGLDTDVNGVAASARQLQDVVLAVV
jgi:hypothetical protein